MKTLTTIITATVVITIFKFGGHWLGTELGGQRARQPTFEDIASELAAGDSRFGVLGTKWLMSESQVQKISPFAEVTGENELMESRSMYGRDTQVTYLFENDMLLFVVITFTKASTPDYYNEIQKKLVAEYGSMPTPAVIDGNVECNKTMGQLTVAHRMQKKLNIQIEQVIYVHTP